MLVTTLILGWFVTRALAMPTGSESSKRSPDLNSQEISAHDLIDADSKVLETVLLDVPEALSFTQTSDDPPHRDRRWWKRMIAGGAPFNGCKFNKRRVLKWTLPKGQISRELIIGKRVRTSNGVLCGGGTITETYSRSITRGWHVDLSATGMVPLPVGMEGVAGLFGLSGGWSHSKTWTTAASYGIPCNKTDAAEHGCVAVFKPSIYKWVGTVTIEWLYAGNTCNKAENVPFEISQPQLDNKGGPSGEYDRCYIIGEAAVHTCAEYQSPPGSGHFASLPENHALWCPAWIAFNTRDPEQCSHCPSFGGR